MTEVVITPTQGCHQHSPLSWARHLVWAPLMASKTPHQVHLGILEASMELFPVNLMLGWDSKCGTMTEALKHNRALASLLDNLCLDSSKCT
jgi:hypothetical protein